MGKEDWSSCAERLARQLGEMVNLSKGDAAGELHPYQFSVQFVGGIASQVSKCRMSTVFDREFYFTFTCLVAFKSHFQVDTCFVLNLRKTN